MCQAICKLTDKLSTSSHLKMELDIISSLDLPKPIKPVKITTNTSLIIPAK